MDQVDLQRLTLKLLFRPGDKRLGSGRHYLSQALKNACAGPVAPTREEIQATFWSLVAQGLAYIDMSQPAPTNWELKLTPAGRAVLTDEQYDPNDPAKYLQRLRGAIPELSPTVEMYLQEALAAFTARLYVAASAMLGVASEGAFLELADAFASTLDHEQERKFRAIVDNPRQSYNGKFREFRKRIEPRKSDLPNEFAEGMDLTLNSVLDLLRANRNDAGHPTGKSFERDDCFISLHIAARLLKKMYGLKKHFEANAATAS